MLTIMYPYLMTDITILFSRIVSRVKIKRAADCVVYCSPPVTPHYARRRHSAAGAGRPPRPRPGGGRRQRDQLPPVRGAGGGRGGLGPGRRRDGLHRGGGHQDLHRGGLPSRPVRDHHRGMAAGHHRGRHVSNE